MESNLISTCIVCDSNDVKYSIYELKKLSKNLESSFLYYELIVLVDKSASNEFIQNLNSINNLRILISKTSFNQYEKRQIICYGKIVEGVYWTLKSKRRVELACTIPPIACNLFFLIN